MLVELLNGFTAVICLAIASSNLSAVDLLRTRRLDTVLCRKRGAAVSEVLAKPTACWCFALRWYFKLEVLR